MIENMLTYEMYLEKATEDEKKVIDSIYNQSKLSKETIDKVKNIKKNINILVFAEPYCKDCAVVLCCLMKMKDLNNNMNIKILPRKNNEDILEKYNNEKRIPTIINLDNKEKEIFSEFPKVIQEKIKDSEDEKSVIISEFRSGKYDNFVEKDLMEILS
ncbi:MAG: thioredoxin family protein [Clostridium perfringens]|nr:thioredoxin family protein [Clostridium perfringens]